MQKTLSFRSKSHNSVPSSLRSTGLVDIALDLAPSPRGEGSGEPPAERQPPAGRFAEKQMCKVTEPRNRKPDMSQDADSHPDVRFWTDQIEAAQDSLSECEDAVERTYIRAEIRRMKKERNHLLGSLAAARSGELSADQFPY